MPLQPTTACCLPSVLAKPRQNALSYRGTAGILAYAPMMSPGMRPRRNELCIINHTWYALLTLFYVQPSLAKNIDSR